MERQDRQTLRVGALIQTQALIIGAGPVGLYQAFQLGLLGLTCHLLDVLPHLGGQCTQLYADKPIYDIPGLPRCTASELIERLHQQIAPFGVPVHLGQQVVQLEQDGERHFKISTQAGLTFQTELVFIAAGAGAFMARHLALDGLSELKGVYHASDDPAADPHAHVIVAGGDALIMPTLRAWVQRPFID